MTAITETSLVTALQAVLLTTKKAGKALFASGDVTINSWALLDGPSENAPFCIIETSNDFDIGRDVQTSTGWLEWVLQFSLIERFADWNTSLEAFKTDRELILGVLTQLDAYPADCGYLAFGLRGIRNAGPIQEVYAPGSAKNALPAYLAQTLLLTVSLPQPL